MRQDLTEGGSKRHWEGVAGVQGWQGSGGWLGAGAQAGMPAGWLRVIALCWRTLKGHAGAVPAAGSGA